jgi:hypothetical protein
MAPEQDRDTFMRMKAYPPVREFPAEYVLDVPVDSIIFDSKFESGNLRKVVKV